MNLTAHELSLLSTLEPKLQTSARRLARSNSRVDADDALQTGRLAALKAIPRLNRDLTQEMQVAFLATSANWSMKDLTYDADGIHCPPSQRGERNRARRTLAQGGEVDIETRNRLGALLARIHHSGDPFIDERPTSCRSVVDNLETDLFVKLLLEKLPEVDASAFTLVFLYDFSYEEASQMMKVSNATLRSRLRAAKRVLKAALLPA